MRLFGLPTLSALDLPVDRIADQIQARLAVDEQRIDTRRRAIGERQRDPLGPLLLPSHAVGNSMHMKFGHASPFRIYDIDTVPYVRYVLNRRYEKRRAAMNQQSDFGYSTGAVSMRCCACGSMEVDCCNGNGIPYTHRIYDEDGQFIFGAYNVEVARGKLSALRTNRDTAHNLYMILARG